MSPQPLAARVASAHGDAWEQLGRIHAATGGGVHRVPWGVRVPAGAAWDAGRWLFRERLLGLEPEGFARAPEVDGLEVVTVTLAELDEVAEVDAAAFGGSPDLAVAGALDVWVDLARDRPLSAPRPARRG